MSSTAPRTRVPSLPWRLPTRGEDVEAETIEIMQAKQRTTLRPDDERLAESFPIAGEPQRGRAEGGTILHPVTDAVEAARVDGRALLRCSSCAHDLGDYDGD
jgi:hypothetical protein